MNSRIEPDKVEFNGRCFTGRPCRILITRITTQLDKKSHFQVQWSLPNGLLAPSGAHFKNSWCPSFYDALVWLDKNGFRSIDHRRFL